jgi:hypothetical protein
MIYTTLNKIRNHNPCCSGWEKLLKNLGKTQADDEQLSMLTILDSNGLDDALWCLRACDGIDREARLFAVACVRRVRHLMTDPASVNALEVAERYAHGQATEHELFAARAAAEAAEGAAEGFAAWAAARTAAWAAAWAAAWDAAWAAWAAWDAAWAAWAAEGFAEGAAARAAERAWQEQEFKRVFCGGEK